MTGEVTVVTVCYWGALEPLGRSLLVPPARVFGSALANYILVTFEKPKDVADQRRVDELRQELERHRVTWIPKLYHKAPKWPATAFDVLQGVVAAIQAVRRYKGATIVGRTFVGGIMAALAARLTASPWLYHNEGFYPDEQVDGGVWRRGSLPHRLACAIERRLYQAAHGHIVLSHRAARDVLSRFPSAKPLVVAPSAVNLKHFVPRISARPAGPLRLIYIGSVGARYVLDEGARFVRTGLDMGVDVHLRVLSQSDPLLIRTMLQAGGLSESHYSVGYVPHEEIPLALTQSDAGLFFLRQGLSEHGCSPTKVGEYWAAGLPVVTSPNVSDLDAIISEDNVGAVVQAGNAESMIGGWKQLLRLIQDPETPMRARGSAERHYNLDESCQRVLKACVAVRK